MNDKIKMQYLNGNGARFNYGGAYGKKIHLNYFDRLKTHL